MEENNEACQSWHEESMKTRFGFVSNSSSSSFIMVGALIDLTDGQAEELEQTGLDVEFETDVPGGNNAYLVGKILAYAIEEETGGTINLKAALDKVEQLFNENGLDGEIQLFYGNVQC